MTKNKQCRIILPVDGALKEHFLKKYPTARIEKRTSWTGQVREVMYVNEETGVDNDA